MSADAQAKRMYSVEEAAWLLSMGRTKAFAELKSGRLKSVRIGRSRLIPSEYIDDFVELLKREPDEDSGEADASAPPGEAPHHHEEYVRTDDPREEG